MCYNINGRNVCDTYFSSVFRFEEYFSDRVKQLIFTFPEDAPTSTGAPFWSAPKRFPQPLQFSTSDPSNLHFVMAASILRAETFGISVPDWVKKPKALKEAIDKVMVPEFRPQEGVKIETDEKVTNLTAASIDDSAVIDELTTKLEQLRKTLPSSFRMKPIQFEKVFYFFTIIASVLVGYFSLCVTWSIFILSSQYLPIYCFSGLCLVYLISRPTCHLCRMMIRITTWT